jgi:hypothetical protein
VAEAAVAFVLFLAEQEQVGLWTDHHGWSLSASVRSPGLGRHQVVTTR